MKETAAIIAAIALLVLLFLAQPHSGGQPPTQQVPTAGSS